MPGLAPGFFAFSWVPGVSFVSIMLGGFLSRFLLFRQYCQDYELILYQPSLCAGFGELELGPAFRVDGCGVACLCSGNVNVDTPNLVTLFLNILRVAMMARFVLYIRRKA